MTYKNIKFEDSAVMRSLERVAVEKGLVKPDILKKEASARPEEVPQTLSEKILKLCEGLREQGFQKYANEVEVKFLMFKKAENSLYDVTKEEGKDLIEFAHPDGGKKLDKGWSELGTVETILEKQRKIQEVVKKKPTGKLASKNIVNAVRIVLAENVASNPYEIALHAFENFRKVFKHAANAAGLDADYGDDWFAPLEKLLKAKDAAGLTGYFSGPSGTNLMETWIKNLKDDAEPGVLFDSFGPRQNNWRKIVYADLDDSALKYANIFEEAIKSIISSGQETENKNTKAYDPETDDTVANSIMANDFAQKVNADKQQAAEVASQLASIANRPSVSSNQQRAAFIEAVSKVVQNYTNDLNQMSNNLEQLGSNTMSLDNISKVTQGTKIFGAVNSYDKFKETAQSFHDAVNQRIKAMQGW